MLITKHSKSRHQRYRTLEGLFADCFILQRMTDLGVDDKAFKLQSLDDKLEGQLEVSYNLYKTFWGLQKFLHEPLLLLNSPQGAQLS